MTTPPTSRPATSAGARPTNDDIEAVIQMATSAVGGAGHLPPRDTRTQLFVGNLPYRVRWQDLKDLFRRAGTVLRADVSLAPDNRSRGYGTVLLATAEDAGRAVDMFNGFVWQTRTLEVRLDRMAGEDHQMQPQGLSGGVGLSTGPGSATGSGAGTPFAQPRSARMPSSPSLFPLDDRYLKAASPIAGLASPTALQAQLTGSHTPLTAHLTGGGGERSRNLFVGNLPFHIQWQDLKDLFRQAGTILRADVALGPDGRSRGFGTVVFATEMDAERAVRMFNGYEFNGRQLKVHFDKFSASSATALPLAGLGVNPALGPGLSLSAPQSPRTSARPSTLTHAASFAQQLLMQQHEQARQNQSLFGAGLDSSRDGFLQAPFNSLQRSNTDSHAQTFRFNMDDTTSLSPSTVTSGVASAVPKSMFEHPGALNRAKSDSAQLFSHSGNLQTPPRMQDSQHSRQNSQSQLYQVTSDQPQQTSMHISLPPVRPPYAYDFSPGSPYDVYQFSTSNNGQYESWQPEQLSGQGEPAQSTSNHTSEAILRNPLSLGDNIFDNLPRPSTSPSPAPMSNDSSKSKPRSFAQHGHSQSESFRVVSSSTSPQNSQPQTQATSPTAASPTLSHQSASIQSSSATSPNTMHPAHPGPITLPPPPNVAAFPIPPTHAFSPHGAYPIQTSPYASPLHHPAVMMGMMGMNMTPHGLPPITPSMPSFTFLPQPSPTAPTYEQAGGSQGLPPANGSGDAQQPHPGAYLPHLHHPAGAMLSPYTPFSPGVAMTPGAFWGRPGSGPNPYINPAVGAPVHASQSGYFPPMPSGPRQPEEPQGYFPPVFGGATASTSKPSGLANEIELESASGSAGEPSVRGGEYSYGADIRPGSSSTTAATTVRTETSPNLPSSNGTSWQTDSADPSPLGNLVKDMDKLEVQDVHADSSREGQPKPRANSAGALSGVEHPGITRADSDPIQKSTAPSTTS